MNLSENEVNQMKVSLKKGREHLNALEIKAQAIIDETNRLTERYEIAIQGLKAICESGDCGGIAEKTLNEINNI